MLKETFKQLLSDIFSLLRFRTQPKIEDMDSLVEFLSEHTSFQLQRNLDTYCRMRVGSNWQKLYKDDAFHLDYQKTIWNAYPFVLMDVLQMTGLTLCRDFDCSVSFTKTVLLLAAKSVVLRQKPPNIVRPDWEDNCANILAKTADLDLLSNKPINQIPIIDYYKIFKELPFVRELKILDYDSLLVNQRFLLCNTHAKFKDVFVKESFLDNCADLQQED